MLRQRDCHATLAMTKWVRWMKVGLVARTHPICHREEHSDAAISVGLNTRRRTAVATATGLPRYARNDEVGTMRVGLVTRTHPTCHCEEHSDAAISMRLKIRRRTAVATTTGLPRYARNDEVGTMRVGLVTRTHPTCHCEEHSDAAISMRLKIRRRTAVATTTVLQRFHRGRGGWFRVVAGWSIITV